MYAYPFEKLVMKLKKLKLKGSVRLLHNGINYYEITLTSAYQILIGTNGSGKSSVLYELSPLPGDKANFVKGGFKIIELEDKGNEFVLSSFFDHGSKHSFLVNGEEKNDGGTSAVQKDLVADYFGYTKDLHDIMVDETTFTTMSTAKRREWLTELSGTDLDFAIDLHNKLKTAFRDHVGIVKHLSNRLTVESEKLLSPETVATMESDTKQLHSELNLIMQSMENNVHPSGQYRQSVEKGLNAIENEAKRLLNQVIVMPDYLKDKRITCLADINNEYMSVQNALTVNDQMLTGHKEEFHQLAELIEALTNTGAKGIDDLEANVVDLQFQCDTYRSRINEYFIETLAKETMDETMACAETLFETIQAIPDNAFGEFSRTKHEEMVESYRVTAANKEKAMVSLSKVNHRIGHMQVAQESNCPKCGYVWKEGVSDRELEELQSKAKTIEAYIINAETSLTQLKGKIEESDSYFQSVKRFKYLCDGFPKLRPLWDHCMEANYVMTSPRKVLMVFTSWKNDVNFSMEWETVHKRLVECQHAIEFAHKLNTDGSGHLGQRIEKLEAEIELRTQKNIEYKKILGELQVFQSQHFQLLEEFRRLDEWTVRVQSHKEQLVKALRNESLKSVMETHQLQLANMTENLVSARVATDLVNDIARSREESELARQAYSILVDELSPVDGLIADQLKGFIQCFIDQCNAIIGCIWTYDLQVLPCGMESGELDYRFPVMVKNDDNPMPDVSKCSAGIMDIIDFAFKLTVMLYKGMENCPIPLDELARTMDEQHRINIMRYVKELVENHRASQLIMVSHYSSMFGSFANAEVCVMDPSNLLHIPTNANKHVVIQ